jgi:hypothetical protein
MKMLDWHASDPSDPHTEPYECAPKRLTKLTVCRARSAARLGEFRNHKPLKRDDISFAYDPCPKGAMHVGLPRQPCASTLSPCGRGWPAEPAGRGVNSRGLADFCKRQLGAPENELVRKAQNSEALLREPSIPAPVVQALLFAVVGRSVELDNQTSLKRDEVRDIAANRYLPLELQSVEAACSERVPNDLFCASHGTALFLCGCSQPPRSAPMSHAAFYQMASAVHPSPGRLRRPPSPARGEGRRARARRRVNCPRATAPL